MEGQAGTQPGDREARTDGKATSDQSHAKMKLFLAGPKEIERMAGPRAECFRISLARLLLRHRDWNFGNKRMEWNGSA